jgi:pentose-5-phosphate-3-epimerase
VEVALALRPSTDIALLEPYIDDVVFVQCMGNDKIGYHGVALEERAVDMIARIHARWPKVLIGVDIGVNKDTIPRLYSAGARRFATGSAVFGGGDPSGAITALRAIVDTCEAQYGIHE